MSLRTRHFLAARTGYGRRGRGIGVRGCVRAVGWVVTTLALCAGALAQGLQGTELFVNGDLSAGATGWFLATTDDTNPNNGTATWFLATVGDPTPINGLETSSEGAAEGDYLVTDQQIQSRLAVFQYVTIPTANTFEAIVLSFDMYVNDYANVADVDPNQYVTVDVMLPNADPLDIQGNAVYNVYTGTDGGPLPNPFFRHVHDITAYVQPGEEYMIRFLANVNLSVLNVGVDNVSVLAVVPEPAGAAAVLCGGLWFARLARRRGPTSQGGRKLLKMAP